MKSAPELAEEQINQRKVAHNTHVQRKKQLDISEHLDNLICLYYSTLYMAENFIYFLCLVNDSV